MQGTGAYGSWRRLALALILFAGMGACAATAQTTPTPAAPPAAAPAPAAPATPPANAPPASSPAAPAPTQDTTGASPGDTSISQTIDVQPKPAVILSGSATWDSGFKTLTDVFAQLNDAISKNGLATAGHPLAVFTSTDDAGFKYSAMIPIAEAPAGKTELTPDIKVGETPGGKAIRFQHRSVLRRHRLDL